MTPRGARLQHITHNERNKDNIEGCPCKLILHGGIKHRKLLSPHK